MVPVHGIYKFILEVKDSIQGLGITDTHLRK